MNYQETLEAVKKQNPGMPHKEAMKKASETFARFKEAEKTLAAGGTNPVETRKNAVVATSEIEQAEKRLRQNPIDINSLIATGLQVIPAGVIVKHGLEGVNTKVTFEDKAGHRLPAVGYFYIYM